MVSNVRHENEIKKKPSVKKSKGKPKLSKLVHETPNKDDATVVPIEIAAELKINKTEENEPISIEELSEKYPVLKDKALVEKFLNVPLNNNQKGRIRQVLKDQLKDASDSVLPDVIYNKILSIIKDSQNLTEAELRKLRILYNMLRTAVQTDKPVEKKNKKKNKKNKKNDKTSIENTTQDKLENVEEIKEQKKEKADKEAQNKLNKLKRSKRYVVFVGNLPPEIDTATIKNHFKELSDNIVSVRIPKLEEGKKSSIAYLELNSELSYEMALSKHHSMLGPKRINVLYTMQKNSKISKTEAKSKSAKLIALQKSGKLAGSVPMYRKRSHRRAKAKRAQAQASKE